MKYLYLLAVLLQLSTLSSGAPQEYPIKHVIVLMLENRAFDHMLGFLKQSLNSDIDGLFGNESNPVNPFQKGSEEIYVSHDAPYVGISPGHGVLDSTLQIFGGPQGYNIYPPLMNGFVKSADDLNGGAGVDVMKCFNSTAVPAISTLAAEFGLFDHWYSSVPGPTEVNRLFVHSATSHGMGSNDLTEMIEGLPQKPIFMNLEEAGVSWNIYFEEVTTTLFLTDMRDPIYADNFKQFEFFEYDVNNGYLPQYSFLEPRYFDFFDWKANDQHPAHSVGQGDLLIKTVYDILRNSPVWNESLLLITYDEHGGFYDHVPPPMHGVPNPDGLNSSDPVFNFTRLGVRVPMLAVSPWINKGMVYHQPTKLDGAPQYEHSSIPATLKNIFGLDSFLTKRDAWAATFEDIVLQRDSPRTDCPTSLPGPTKEMIEEELDRKMKDRTPIGDGFLNDLQKGYVEFAGILTGDESWKLIRYEYEAAEYCRRQFSKFLGKKYSPLKGRKEQ